MDKITIYEYLYMQQIGFNNITYGGTMNWEQICRDPHLQDLPFKIEMNGFGEIIMNQNDIRHSLYAEKIFRYIKDGIQDGYSPIGLAVETEDGVCVPDVVWISKVKTRN